MEVRCACLSLSSGGLSPSGAISPNADAMNPGTLNPNALNPNTLNSGTLNPSALGPDADPFINRPHQLPWGAAWSEQEVREEESRRVVWSALSLVSEYVAQCETFNEAPGRFWITEAANYALFFPGEILDRHAPAYQTRDGLCAKESVYALFCRAMLLWNFCNRFREPSRDEERAEQAQEAFLEAQAIEDALNAHRCNLDTTIMYTCREYLHNTRMLVAQAFRG
ncbi:hypothetical protein NLJ89_g12271 [Agrocybe chaxingu]|uniref:Uncharacterized protein n=1 Tax=Agrocybe chaxingu TaxID=84603 RepID=A0A9W8JUR6_9AGAR|nr:hypothetical protein NLJ89_g12271 [Agrocybe chaxingu]